MTAADIPTTTGMPNNGAEGMRFVGYPVFEPLVDWDLQGPDNRRAGFRPGLATRWGIDETRLKWTFELRREVRFHDGSLFTADAVTWNLARIYDERSPQFEATASGIARARVPQIVRWEKVDDYTVSIWTRQPTSFLPQLIAWIPFASPAQYEKVGRDWAAFARQPSGTGPFRITRVTPRQSIEMERNTAYWAPERRAKVDRVTLFPMPEANTRLAALRSGQVDWIEVPPPDAIPSLRQAGFQVSTKPYPHIWPWVFSMQEDSPFRDKRVRHAANWGVDRDGLVRLLNGTAMPASGFVASEDINYGKPSFRFGHDPERARALMREAGFGPNNPARIRVMISTSGSGQMMPIPMNELIQQNLEQCFFRIEFDVVEWGQMLLGFRQPPDSAINRGRHAMNISLTSTDPSVWFRWFHGAAATPVSSNWGHWRNEAYDRILDEVAVTFDEESVDRLLARAHEILVEESPWLWVVHDLNPRAFSPRLRGFRPAQSWMQDLTQVTLG